ncbi:hypothetical protein BIV57_21505 [Mangrovactinospora gilvigrisea]|uniref:Type II secretion system protein GspF domain-containing protein n=1 Tax=Mangrovactinospora gilvigrisea TaxID=1428644 RepID=A0A1J7BA09_9ACTN|nr:hypothetical protein [Mangrovactinospora gilvigrisea]OIV35446.1 hypothetical protein BIV57_21505 [Mangrovactinospora gilvigrisea]
MISPWALIAGAAVGGGLALLAAELRPAPPELGAALGRLRSSVPTVRPEDAAAADRPGLLDRLGGRMTGLPGVRIPRRDLALIGRTPARFMAHKGLFALIGLALPAYGQAVWTLFGLNLPVVVPAVAAPVLAVLLWLLPDAIAAGEAKEARVEYLHGVAAYLELVALERAADCGPAEAMSRAARVGRGAVFLRMRDAIDAAAVDRRPPWVGLGRLAEELGLAPLQDVADIMRLSGADGAAVYGTLRARAKSLRSELLAEDLAKANTDSERMVIPGSALVMVMVVMIAFPALYQMFTTG